MRFERANDFGSACRATWAIGTGCESVDLSDLSLEMTEVEQRLLEVWTETTVTSGRPIATGTKVGDEFDRQRGWLHEPCALARQQ